MYYKIIRNKVVNSVKKYRTRYIINEIDNCENDKKMLWRRRTLKTIIGKESSNSHIGTVEFDSI